MDQYIIISLLTLELENVGWTNGNNRLPTIDPRKLER